MADVYKSTQPQRCNQKLPGGSYLGKRLLETHTRNMGRPAPPPLLQATNLTKLKMALCLVTMKGVDEKCHLENITRF